MEDIENVLDGNLCRCTGYRPILDAFKSFANNVEGVSDIEDVQTCIQRSRAVGKMASNAGDWFMPTSLADLITVLDQLPPGSSYRLVHGNTGRGKSTQYFIDT